MQREQKHADKGSQERHHVHYAMHTISRITVPRNFVAMQTTQKYSPTITRVEPCTNTDF